MKYLLHLVESWVPTETSSAKEIVKGVHHDAFRYGAVSGLLVGLHIPLVKNEENDLLIDLNDSEDQNFLDSVAIILRSGEHILLCEEHPDCGSPASVRLSPGTLERAGAKVVIPEGAGPIRMAPHPAAFGGSSGPLGREEGPGRTSDE